MQHRARAFSGDDLSLPVDDLTANDRRMNCALRLELVKGRKLRLRKEPTRIYLRFLLQVNQDNIAIGSLLKLGLGLETENPCWILTEKFHQKRDTHLLSVDKCQHQWQRRFQSWDPRRASAASSKPSPWLVFFGASTSSA